jgi:hypothetical protein
MRVFFYIIIGVVVLLGIVVGYVLSYPCENPPSVDVLKYIHGLKCKSVQEGEKYGTLPKSGELINATGEKTSKEGGVVEKKSQVGVVYNDKVKNYFINEGGDIFIVDYSGNIIKINKNQNETINDTSFGYPKNVLFYPYSQNDLKILINFSDFISIFDTQSKNWRQIPLGSFGADFGLDNNLFYFQKEGVGVSLFKLNLSKENSTPQKLIQLNILDSRLIVKNKDEIFIVSKPSSLVGGYVLLFNTKNKNLSSVFELNGLYFNWDPKTQNGLVLTSNELNRGGRFFLVNKDLKTKELSFVTLPNKCYFYKESVSGVGGDTKQTTSTSQDFMICAIPRNQEILKNKYIIDDYLSYDLYTEDDIYRINLSDGSANILFNDENKNFDMEYLQFIKNKVFFINRYDKKLYVINLNN